MLVFYVLGGLVMLAASIPRFLKALGRLLRRDDCIECGHLPQLHDPVHGCVAASSVTEGNLRCRCRFEI